MSDSGENAGELTTQPPRATSTWLDWTWKHGLPVIATVTAPLLLAMIIGWLDMLTRVTHLNSKVEEQGKTLTQLQVDKADLQALNATLLNVQNSVNRNGNDVANLQSAQGQILQTMQQNATLTDVNERDIDSLRTLGDGVREQVATLRERIAKLEASQPQSQTQP